MEEAMARLRTGSIIIGNRTFGHVTQVEFRSKQHACRDLGITMKRLERIIEESIPTEYEGVEYFFDELI